MSLLEETIAAITSASSPAADAAAARIASELPDARSSVPAELLTRYLRATGNAAPDALKTCTIIFCADHGIAREEVSAYRQETTVEMTANYLISQGAAANAFAQFVGSDLLVVDMGIAADTSSIPGLVTSYKLGYGTRSMIEGPAMTPRQARAALETGIKLALAIAAQGYTCFLPGEMGIANTTASACITAALCGLTPREATGRGTNISDERLEKKIRTVAAALIVNQPSATDGLDVLTKVGGFELGAMAGLMLGAAASHAVTILDGFNASAAALIAQSLAPSVTDYLLPSHQGGETGHGAALKKLGLTPHFFLDLRLGEACGSSLTAKLLENALIGLAALSPAAEHGDKDTETQEATDEILTIEPMPEKPPKVTDKTFNFYLRTMPELSHKAMAACQERLDHLAKPLYSLGHLESIAAELAGILAEDRPGKDTSFGLLLFGTEPLPDTEESVLLATLLHDDLPLTLGRLRRGLPPTAAFDFGRVTAEDITFDTSVLGLGFSDRIDAELCAALANEDGSLRYAPEDFLAHVPASLQPHAAALLGAIIAAVHNSALVLFDSPAASLIARYAERLAPAIRSYLLPLTPQLMRLGPLPAGQTAEAGILLVRAALSLLNDMKTFEETQVSPASEGPGKSKQRDDRNDK